jgi:hypothetical protein
MMRLPEWYYTRVATDLLVITVEHDVAALYSNHDSATILLSQLFHHVG